MKQSRIGLQLQPHGGRQHRQGWNKNVDRRNITQHHARSRQTEGHTPDALQTGFIRKPFVWYIKVYPVPEGGEWRVGLCGGGFLRLCGMSVYPNNRITLNLTTVNAVRPLRGRHHLRIHTASSASLHMRLSYVGRLRCPATHCCHPKDLRMNPNRGLSRRKRPPSAL